MRTFLDKLSQYALLRAALYLILGALLIIAPQIMTNIVIYLLAGCVAIFGVIQLVQALRRRSPGGPLGLDFAGGVFLLVLALMIVLFARSLLSMLPIFFGILIIIGGISYLLQALNARGSGHSNIALWIFAIGFIVLGLIVLVNPFATALLLFRVFGAALVALGISEAYTFFLYRR